jgi:hypothetical protein
MGPKQSSPQCLSKLPNAGDVVMVVAVVVHCAVDDEGLLELADGAEGLLVAAGVTLGLEEFCGFFEVADGSDAIA